MSEYPSTGLSEAVLLSIMQQVTHLDWQHLTQLHAHLGEMIDQMKPVPLPENAPPEIVELSKENPALCGARGEGYIEWKTIRQGDKVYGPYPYWRFIRNGKRYSIYLKDLARQLRQDSSTNLPEIPEDV
ncbi:hypothetical protein IFO70_38355 [Phormidium tenue FACHB-886]|nr:hypothetical protein [Phormidium tenue FACHB-886]